MLLRGGYVNKPLFWLCSVAFLSACAFSTRVPYQVNSNPPGAQIYVNGVSMGIAPTQIELRCDERWFCPADDPPCRWKDSDYVYEITAVKDNTGFSQTKHVNPCQIKAPGQIDFDIASGPPLRHDQ
jgi:hypothetical protein